MTHVCVAVCAHTRLCVHVCTCVLLSVEIRALFILATTLPCTWTPALALDYSVVASQGGSHGVIFQSVSVQKPDSGSSACL